MCLTGSVTCGVVILRASSSGRLFNLASSSALNDRAQGLFIYNMQPAFGSEASGAAPVCKVCGCSLTEGVEGPGFKEIGLLKTN